MLEKRFPRKLHATLLVAAPLIAIFLSVTGASAGSKEKVLYTFCSVGNCTDGSSPVAGLIFDAAGNLYGTTPDGGDYGYGTVFQLVTGANGAWSRKVLHSFKIGTKDGLQPEAGLIFDAAGNLYGTTVEGGGPYNGGTVFKLTPQANGDWKEEVLHSFKSEGEDGSSPVAGLVFDASGSLYGTTVIGGAHNRGTVFKLAPQANGSWKEKVLHSFGKGTDGYLPYAGLIFDAKGNLYGTTAGSLYSGCGEHQHHCGAVFKLTPGANGRWSETVLHNFTSGGDGNHPVVGLILDATGNLYGTTLKGGAYNGGAVFQLVPERNGAWTESVLYSFCFATGCTDGYYPYAGLVFDAAGNLYGTTWFGGAYKNGDYCPGGCGTAFELVPGTNGKWTEKVLHSFDANGKDGYEPVAGLTIDAAGNLYGTTPFGGRSELTNCVPGIGCGSVFEITP